MGTTLFIVSIILTAIFGPIGLLISMVLHIITFRWLKGLKMIDNMFKSVAIAIDQLGNVLCGTLFNKILIYENGYAFGNRLLTVSYVLGVNQLQGTLTGLGRSLVFTLDVVENFRYLLKWLFLREKYFRIEHCIKAVQVQQAKDIEAINRNTYISTLLQTNNYD